MEDKNLIYRAFFYHNGKRQIVFGDKESIMSLKEIINCDTQALVSPITPEDAKQLLEAYYGT